MSKSVRILLVAAAAALFIATLSVARADYARQLEATFAALETLGVRSVHFDEGCARLDYGRGAYVDNTACLMNLMDQARPVDEQARLDLSDLRRFLAAVGVHDITAIDVARTPDGRVAPGTTFRTGACIYYEYAPGHDYVPMRIGDWATVSELDADWFVVDGCAR